jgi:hypothetical protein
LRLHGMAGSHFDPPVRTVVQEESAQGAEMSRVAQKGRALATKILGEGFRSKRAVRSYWTRDRGAPGDRSRPVYSPPLRSPEDRHEAYPTTPSISSSVGSLKRPRRRHLIGRRDESWVAPSGQTAQRRQATVSAGTKVRNGPNPLRPERLLTGGPSHPGAGEEGRLRFARAGARSASSIQTGAWSLAFSQPRTSRSTPAALRRGAAEGLNSRWSMRRPASRA